MKNYMVINCLPKSPKISISLGLSFLFYKIRALNQMVIKFNILLNVTYFHNLQIVKKNVQLHL